ncbi:MAG: ABC transporter permease [Euryarchaeota archaeon]|nr:ABC transporter permease [Euryarchaeota archaeon]MDE1835287.1 ABC transporter permease [Euryarchaeota archaeon]MDE1881064.1 ABC transporter permease [Euryarchaeota archaeon]MDE2043583.1 ABC transporter permease [Thermoplasmata archaeon]
MNGVFTQLRACMTQFFKSAQRELGLILAFFLLFPLGFLFFLSILVQPSFRPQILVGSIMMEVALININVLAQSVAQDKQSHFFDLWVSFPVSPLVYVLGNALPWLPVSLLTAGVTLAMGIYLFGISVAVAPLLLLVALVLIWSSTTGIGYLVAVYGGNPRQVNMLAQFVGIVMTFFAPIYYPVTALPLAAQYVAYAWPLTWGAILLKALFASNLTQAAIAILVLSLYTAAGYALIALGLRWRAK